MIRALIKRPIASIFLGLALILVGLTAWRLLPVAPLPQVNFPTIEVRAELPGASPESIASTVAAPLERALGSIPGVTAISSSSNQGATRVLLQFALDRDINAAARDVQAAINASQSDLPAGMPGSPTYRKVNPSQAPIMALALSSPTRSAGALYDIGASILAQRLAQVSGVGKSHSEAAPCLPYACRSTLTWPRTTGSRSMTCETPSIGRPRSALRVR
ncbi:acrB/AcrD/AcrF family protein [Bordetella holmesii 35009]|nr:acrB/AcrD/AcrF family protein [Bordetella holmesii 35009]